MSLLKIYDTSKIEFEKDYQRLCNTILDVEGDYIPAWYFENSETITNVYIEELNIDKLKNKEIEIDLKTLISPYTNSSANGYLYSDKFAYTLDSNKIYRIAIQTTISNYYSDLFRKI